MPQRRLSRKRRISTRRRRTLARPRKGVLPKFYTFKRSGLDVAPIIDATAGNTDSFGSYTFTLNSLPNYTEFTTLFDQYRITNIRAMWMPNVRTNTPSSASSTLLGTVPPLITVVDYDDNTAVDYLALMQYSNAKVHEGFSPFSMSFRPNASLAAYSGAFTSYAAASRNQWYDVASPSIQFYGLKWASFPYPATAVYPAGTSLYWDIMFTYTIDCRYPR